MSKKDNFIKFVEELISVLDPNEFTDVEKDAIEYFNAFKSTNTENKVMFTENGKLILQYIRDNKDNCGNMFKAKDIGEGLSITSRTASGAMRKLVTDGYIEKIGTNPVVYSLTQLGAEVVIPEEE